MKNPSPWLGRPFKGIKHLSSKRRTCHASTVVQSSSETQQQTESRRATPEDRAGRQRCTTNAASVAGARDHALHGRVAHQSQDRRHAPRTQLPKPTGTVLDPQRLLSCDPATADSPPRCGEPFHLQPGTRTADPREPHHESQRPRTSPTRSCRCDASTRRRRPRWSFRAPVGAAASRMSSPSRVEPTSGGTPHRRLVKARGRAPWWGPASRDQSPPPTPRGGERKPGRWTPTPVPARLTARARAAGAIAMLCPVAIGGASAIPPARASRDGLAVRACGWWCSRCVPVRHPGLPSEVSGWWGSRIRERRAQGYVECQGSPLFPSLCSSFPLACPISCFLVGHAWIVVRAFGSCGGRVWRNVHMVEVSSENFYTSLWRKFDLWELTYRFAVS